MTRRKLPPLNALSTLEEVAIHRSCSDAAAHLGLTQSAVSKQVQTMERFIGLPLFSRVKGGLIPNAIGERLLADIQPLLNEMERIFDRASREATNRRVVIVRALPMFADKWLLPRLRDFFAAYPDIDIQFSTFVMNTPFDRGGAEIEILFGSGPWLGADSTLLAGGECVLIAPPGTDPETPLEDVLRLPRIVHAQAREAWQEFSEATGVQVPSERGVSPTFDVYQVLVKAVHIGMGIALVPRCLVIAELEQGLVVNPGGYAFESRLAYHVLVPHRAKPLSLAARTLHDWILACAHQTPG